MDVFNNGMMNPWSGCLRDAASSLLLKSNISSSDHFSEGGIPTQLEVPELGKGPPGEFFTSTGKWEVRLDDHNSLFYL